MYHLLLLLFVSLVLAEKRHTLEHKTALDVPAGWEMLREADPTEVLPLIVAVKQRNVHLLEKALLEVSDPNHPAYGKHWNNDQITDLVSPSKDSLKAVFEWLDSFGVADRTLSSNRDFLKIRVPVRLAETMLLAKFYSFKHGVSGVEETRSLDPYSIPAHLKDHIDFITGHYFTPQTWMMSRKTLHQVALSPSSSVATSNAPLLASVRPGSTRLTIFAGIRCLDGNFNSTSCQHDFLSLQVFLDGEVQFNSDSTCLPCDQWKTNSEKYACTRTSQAYNASISSFLFCLVHVKNLPNYEAMEVKIASLFQSASSDAYLYPAHVTLSEWVSPQSLQKYYDIPVGTTVTNPASTQSVAEFLGQYYSTEDLQSFFSLMGLEDRSADVKVIGFNNQSDAGGEAQLDIEYIMGVAPKAITTFWSISGLNPDQQEPFLEWMLAIQSMSNPPLVHSISYDDQENTIHRDYINRVETEFMKAGLRGLSLLFASGDDGCGGYYLRDDPNACKESSPAWPSTSPWVTSVGGTQFLTKAYPWCDIHVCTDVGEAVSSSKTGSRITTGGGFSNLFARPNYQNSAVSRYLKTAKNLPPTSFFNQTGRAYPDISAVAHNYLVMLKGDLIGVDGTSASTPMVAAMITLFNDHLLSKGRSPLGFLNPWLYNLADKHPTAFMDITVGENSCSANPENCCAYGFPAAPGWDAVTGVGSPLYSVILNLLG